MRIRRLELLRYGKFTDYRAEFPSNGLDLHLVIGANEAGKTTTRSALTELLFGVDSRTTYAFLHDYNNLRIGAELQQGSDTLTVRRKKGNKNTLLDVSDRPIQESVLSTFLGNVHREAFLRMFSLDHESLVEGAKELLSAKDDVGRMLFQASGGLHRLGELRRDLEIEADRLWAPRRSKDRAYYVAFDSFQSTSIELENHVVRVKDFREAESRVNVTQEAVTKCATEQDDIRREIARLERIKRTLPGLLRLRNVARELSEFDNVPLLPENAPRLLQDAQTELVRNQDELKRLNEKLNVFQQRLESLSPNSSIIKNEREISHLANLRHELRRFPDDVAKRRAEVQLLHTQVEDLVQELGWPRATTDAIKSRLPKVIELEAIDQLLSLNDRHLFAVRSAMDALEKHKFELAELIVARDTLVDQNASARLREAVELARQLGDVDARRQDLSVPADLSKKRLIAALSQLSPWQGDLASLRAVVPPSEEELDTLVHLFEHHQKDEDSNRSDATRDSLKLKSLRLSETQVFRDSTPVTREQIELARSARDHQWQQVRQVVLSEIEAPERPFDLVRTYEESSARTDELTDRRFSSASASTELQRIRCEIEQLELACEHTRNRNTELALHKKLLVEKLKLLSPDPRMGFEHPSQLRKWFVLRADVLIIGETAERERLQLQQFERQVTDVFLELRRAIEESTNGQGVSESSTPKSLLRTATEYITQCDVARARRATLLEQIEKLERVQPELNHALERAESEKKSWQNAYNNALLAIGISRDANPQVAKTALNFIREISTKLAKAAAIERERIDTMQRDLDQFGRSTDTLTGALGIQFSDISPFQKVEHLVERLALERQVERERSALEKQVQEIVQQIAEAEHRRSDANSMLMPLYGIAGVDDIASLGQLVERSNRRRELLRDRRQIEIALLESGDGLPIDALENDAAHVDVTNLELALNALQKTSSELSLKRKDLEVAQSDAQRALKAIAGGADAAVAATRRNESVASMADSIERFVRLRTMSVLLKWAMERFRREKQGPLLSRASELFSILTLERFSGLTVESNNDDHPQLLGVRCNGTILGLEAMSTGTADQLYLALRLAALDLHLDEAITLPFIVDDLFVHFDDDRSAAAFRVLSKLAQRTQVLFFTHHEHLVDVAKRALGESFHVTRLE
jgi:uncharacterized protein YhaN